MTSCLKCLEAGGGGGEGQALGQFYVFSHQLTSLTSGGIFPLRCHFLHFEITVNGK